MFYWEKYHLRNTLEVPELVFFLPKFSAFFHQDGFVEMILPLLGVIHGSSTVVMNKTTVARLQ